MPLFKKASRPPPPAPPAAQPQKGPPVDELRGDPAAHWFRDELAQGRGQQLHDFLDGTRDGDDRNWYVTSLAEIKGRPDWLDEWVAARPGSPIPLLFRGTHSTMWAWQARGSDRANMVAEDAWAVFHARLVDADRDLARAAAMDGADPTPYARGLWTAIGLSLGQPEIRRRFGEVTRRHRWHRGAHSSMIQALAAKWYGSDEEMFEFARSASAQAPEGHTVHRVIPNAHLEKWLNLSTESPDGKARQAAYFSDEAVKNEIRRAADRSIRSPRYVAGRVTLDDRNIFAMCFSMMRDHDALLEQMRLIGPVIHPSGWSYLKDPSGAYERARNRALQATQGGTPAGRGT